MHLPGQDASESSEPFPGGQQTWVWGAHDYTLASRLPMEGSMRLGGSMASPDPTASPRHCHSTSAGGPHAGGGQASSSPRASRPAHSW